MRFKQAITSAFFICFICVFGIMPVLAEDDPAGVPFDPSGTFDWTSMETALELSAQEADPVVVAIRLVNTALIFLGVITTLFIMYGGVVWFFARENEEQAKKAIDIVKGAMIGLVLIIFAYGLAYVVWRIFYFASISPT